MTRPIALAAFLIALGVPQAAFTDGREARAPETEERSWIQTLLPTISLLTSG